MNEETIIEKKNQPVENKKQGQPWKAVSLGGFAGILMGAGAMYATNAVAQENEEVEVVPEGGEQEIQIAKVDNGLSFSEAFEAARAEVGPGGVFYWHGGIYNTYTATEWDAMTPEEKAEFAQRVAPEVPVTTVSTPTDSHPDVTIAHPAEPQVTPVAQENGDVHIVGYTEVDGHLAVGYDTDGDGQADVAVIDVDDSGNPSNADVVVTAEGEVSTIGEIVDGNQPDVAMVSEPEPTPQDGDVHIVARTEYQGHDVYGIDLDGDDQIDVAVIDVDDSGNLTGPDVVFNGGGDYATVDELNNAADPNAGYYEVDNTDMYDTPMEPDADAGQFV